MQLPLESTEQRDTRSRPRTVLEGCTCNDSLTTMTTPTSEGWRSGDSIILLGWSVTLVGPGTVHQRRQRREAVGSPATDRAAKHHRSTTGTRSASKLSQDEGSASNLRTSWFKKRRTARSSEGAHSQNSLEVRPKFLSGTQHSDTLRYSTLGVIGDAGKVVVPVGVSERNFSRVPLVLC